jgi:hypothetical protein
MSADRWEACPRCLDRAREAYVNVLSEHGAKYGTVSIEEWADLCANLQPPPDPEDQELQTFREDFEWWTEGGALFGSWRGNCTKCGLNFTHKVGPEVFYDEESA